MLAAATSAVALLPAGPAAAEALLVIEADTGKVLHADKATTPWYPASITKIMTVYVALRAVKEGRMTLESVLKVSSNAAAMPPTKMGFPPGTVITLDNAIKMLMVKSANDVAVVIAEGVGGSVEGFSDLMNAQARRIGMTQSNFVNPHGLPADQQITSARDMAMLARTVLREFPEYNYYWSLPGIRLGKRIYRNHNNLMGRYEGTDGMKTGFICASGFNVVATATRNGRKLIVVVFGSRSGMARSEKAAQLFEKGFASGGLSWLMPSLGTVDALQPIAAAPVNMKEEVCGKHRKRPAADDDEDDDGVQASNPDVDQSSAFAMSSNSLGAKAIKGPLLGPLQASVPLIVYTGPQRSDGGAGLALIAAAPKRKKPVVNIATGADGKPKTANAAAGFVPASATSKPTAAPGDDAKAKTAAKKKADTKKTAAKKPDDKTADQKSGTQAKSTKQ
jgi:D-alanyl-D-alanine carboxypeptidase